AAAPPPAAPQPDAPVGEVGYDDVTPGPDADGGAPGDTGYGYGYPADPETTAITLRPTADMIRAHRRRERRRTLTFLGIFLGVLAMGLASFTFFQGAWSWPFGAANVSAPVCPTPTQTAPPAKNVTVKVYNASSRTGLARTVAGTLKKRGFQIGEVGNDPQEAKVPGVAVIRHGPAGLEAAKTVAAYIDGKVTLVPDERVSESVDLVLGKKFTKVRSAAAAAKALTPTLASVPAGCAPTGGEQSSTPSGSTAPAGTTSPSKGPSKNASKTPAPSAT
uniref:LytR C-terminal domain-containing protein n=1 Tax=Kineosporia sp. R_H_3 TaxID=1961848 RepID=UPI001304646C